jgi:hypothetical protein
MSLKFLNTAVDVYIDTIKVAESGAKISELIIDEYVPMAIPMMELALEVYNEAIESYIYDGCIVSLKLKVEQKESSLWNFRVLGFKILKSSKNSIITISAYYDISRINSSTFYSQDATTSQVATYIAAKAGFTFDGSSTNDKQPWICYGKSLYDFLFDISYNAWSNNTSCIVPCFSNNKLKFVNITDRLSKKAKIKFLEKYEDCKQDTDIFYQTLIVKSSSGVFNQISGYGIKGNNFNVITGNTEEILPVIPFSKSTDKLNINSKLVKNQRSESMPTNCGNTHKNYNIAKLQNLRIKSLYSISLEIHTQFFTGLELLDPVEIVITRGDGKQNNQYSGKYIVERIRYIKDENDTLLFIYDISRPGMNVESDADSSSIQLT